MSACKVCASPDRLLIESWLRSRVPYPTIHARMLERGQKIFNSSLTAHRRHAGGLEVVELYQLRPR
jgi:hypothetical protein